MIKAKDLLKECEDMPALIEERVGKKYDEYAKYFIPLQHQYEQVQKKVQELITRYENHEPNKPKGLYVVKDKPPINPDVLPDDITSDYAIEWVKTFMQYIDLCHKAFTQSRENFLAFYNDQKVFGKLQNSRLLLGVLDRFENADKQKNPDFLRDMKKGGKHKFTDLQNKMIPALEAEQREFDIRVSDLDAALKVYDSIHTMVNQIYQVIALAHGQMMKNSTKLTAEMITAAENEETYTPEKKELELFRSITEVLVEQKNSMDAFRNHLQHIEALSLQLLLLRGKQQNIITRTHTLYITTLKDVF